MCGILGVAGRVSVKEEKLFKQLLIIDSLRGEDSTGIASVNCEKEVKVAKAVGDPFQLLDTTSGSQVFNGAIRVLIGHNRYATTGKVTRKNAHPFEFDTLVGVHNGTLHNKHDLVEGHKFDVDSEALFHNIEKDGVETAIGKTKGAWALVWWDKKAEKLNFLRNKERPLHYVYSEDKKVIFWASEAWMLTAILGRDGYKHSGVHEFEENTHYTFDIAFKSYKDMPDISKPRLKSVTGKKEVAVVHDMGKHQNMSHLGSDGSDYLGSKNKVFQVIAEDKDRYGGDYFELLDSVNPMTDVRLYKSNKTSHIEIGKYFTGDVMTSAFENGKAYYKVSPWSIKDVMSIPKGVDGKLLLRDEFEKKYHTCAWCSNSVSYGDDCHIFDDTCGVLCESCINDAEVNKYVKVV